LNETVVDLLDECFLSFRAQRAATGNTLEASTQYLCTSGACESDDLGPDGIHYDKYLLVKGECFRFNDRENPFTAAYRESAGDTCAMFAELIMLKPEQTPAEACPKLPKQQLP
jgi:hypothetical protein